MNVLEVQGLTKRYPAFTLNGVSFDVPQGAVMGFIGRNGAGKSTTLKSILGMVHPDVGAVRVFGMDYAENERAIRRELGVVLGGIDFYPKKKIKTITDATRRFYNNWDEEKYRHYLELFHIDESKRVDQLSSGMKVKYMIALALSHNARLLILDEPTSGLDPVSRDELLQILSEYIEDGEHSVLFSTHITGDLERAADYITYISYGELFFSGSKDEFVDMFRIVKGGTEELTPDLREKAVGVRTFPTGFEALVKTEDTGAFSSLSIEPATIDEIVVFTSKKGDDYE